MILNRDQILAADDLTRETVEVPEWGGTVVVSTMTGTQRDAFEASIVLADGRADLRDMRAKLAVACIVDEAGAPVFSHGDISSLGRKSAKALERVAKVAQRLNKIGNEELEALKGN